MQIYDAVRAPCKYSPIALKSALPYSRLRGTFVQYLDTQNLAGGWVSIQTNDEVCSAQALALFITFINQHQLGTQPDRFLCVDSVGGHCDIVPSKTM